MNLKKFLASVLVCCVIGRTLPSVVKSANNAVIMAVAVDEYTRGKYESLTYKNFGDYIEISYCDRGVVKAEIPAEINGIKVTSVGDNAFYNCHFLTEITIPDSVTNIGMAAFKNCLTLESITLPEGITNIGSWAFEGCSSLADITFPESFTNTGSQSFANTLWLKNRQQENPLVIVNDILIDGTTYPGDDIIIPDGIASIGGYTFDGLSGLKSITIPDSVTNIGDSAFMGCSGLTEVTIPDSVTRMGDTTFFKCSGLKSINLSNSLTSIGNAAFYDCLSLASITIPDSVTSIDDSAFLHCSGLTEVTIPNSVTSIGTEAFCGCSGLTSVTIPDSVTSIETEVFWGCSSLESITIPNSVTSIGREAFLECSNLTSVFIPDSVTNISYGAFSRCSELTEITIPDSVTSIESHAFYDTPWLESKQKENPLVIVGNGILIDGKTCLDDIVIPESVASIGSSAFYGCLGLTSVTIPESVTSIGASAFYNCSGLTLVTIPDSITSIEESAFSGTPWLESKQKENPLVIVGNGILIDGKTCSGDVVIPESVISIGNGAFSRCKGLTSVTIPESVTSIGYSAFFDCESLTSVKILNPECYIFDNSYTIDNKATIYGYDNSNTQVYAEKYNRKFVSIGKVSENIRGDINDDGEINISDAVLLQKWLLAEPDIELVNWKAADLCEDDRIDVFDMIEMRKLIINSLSAQ